MQSISDITFLTLTMPDKIVIFYQNARSLCSKTKEFYQNILNNEFDIILISETWLVDSISDEKLFDFGCNAYETYSDTSLTGGGVAIGIKNYFKIRSQNSC